MATLFANCDNPDQTPYSAASDLDLHCLPITLLGVSRLQWIKVSNYDNDQHSAFYVPFNPFPAE